MARGRLQPYNYKVGERFTDYSTLVLVEDLGVFYSPAGNRASKCRAKCSECGKVIEGYRYNVVRRKCSCQTTKGVSATRFMYLHAEKPLKRLAKAFKLQLDFKNKVLDGHKIKWNGSKERWILTDLNCTAEHYTYVLKGGQK